MSTSLKSAGPFIQQMLSSRGLLESGKFSDMKVSCGDRTWNLHKAILSDRCPFFENALTGGFKARNTSPYPRINSAQRYH